MAASQNPERKCLTPRRKRGRYSNQRRKNLMMNLSSMIQSYRMTILGDYHAMVTIPDHNPDLNQSSEIHYLSLYFLMIRSDYHLT
jgi:hypothetical protein